MNLKKGKKTVAKETILIVDDGEKVDLTPSEFKLLSFLVDKTRLGVYQESDR